MFIILQLITLSCLNREDKGVKRRLTLSSTLSQSLDLALSDSQGTAVVLLSDSRGIADIENIPNFGQSPGSKKENKKINKEN